MRSKDLSEATRCGFYEVGRPQLCPQRFSKAPRQSSEEVAALEAQSSVPEVDRDRWGYQSYEEGPPDADARLAEVAPAAGLSSVPRVARPNNDGDAVEAICRIVGFTDRKDPE